MVGTRSTRRRGGLASCIVRERAGTRVPRSTWGPKAGEFAGTASTNERVGQRLLSSLA